MSGKHWNWHGTRDKGMMEKKETKATWIPYMDYSHILTGKSEDSFRSEFSRRIDRAAGFGINRVFAHVRPFGDAIYRSKYFPSSYLITGTEGETPPYDPLGIMTEIVHSYGMALEAWINPFRVRNNSLNRMPICSDNPVTHMLETGDAIEHRLGIAYNPASEAACNLIINGVNELCEEYDIDGIHFDDYFYPVTDPFFDMASYHAYKAPGGGLSQKQWRRENISLFLSDCYHAVHRYPGKCFGLSPKGYMECNLEEEFLDVPRILSHSGFVDYICPQAYFAMSDEVHAFSAVMDEFDALIKSDIELIAGLAVYKIGYNDRHAGAGADEWMNGEHVLSDMVCYSRRKQHYAGYSLYNYEAAFLPGSDLEDRILAEMTSLQSIG